jgi:hypothetical protein
MRMPRRVGAVVSRSGQRLVVALAVGAVALTPCLCPRRRGRLGSAGKWLGELFALGDDSILAAAHQGRGRLEESGLRWSESIPQL